MSLLTLPNQSRSNGMSVKTATRKVRWMIGFMFGLVFALASFFSPQVPRALAACPVDSASVYGDIGEFYNAHGGVYGGFGCPTSDEYDYFGGRARKFTFGQIVWIPFNDHPALTIGAYQFRDLSGIRFDWRDSARRDFYLVRYRQDNNIEVQTDEIEDGYQIIGPIYWPNSTFRLKLEGCDKEHVIVRSGSHCYGWLPEVVVVTQPNTPKPPPPPAPVVPPTPPSISVTREGSGGFTVNGSGFTANSTVHVRVVDDFFHEVWYNQTSLNDGTMRLALPNICSGSGAIHFSANDGRPNRADLTGTLWSNTFTTTCP